MFRPKLEHDWRNFGKKSVGKNRNLMTSPRAGQPPRSGRRRRTEKEKKKGYSFSYLYYSPIIFQGGGALMEKESRTKEGTGSQNPPSSVHLFIHSSP
jgi:hypothetical protein